MPSHCRSHRGANTSVVDETIPDGYTDVTFQSVRADSDAGYSITYVAEFAGAEPDPAGVGSRSISSSAQAARIWRA